VLRCAEQSRARTARQLHCSAANWPQKDANPQHAPGQHLIAYKGGLEAAICAHFVSRFVRSSATGHWPLAKQRACQPLQRHAQHDWPARPIVLRPRNWLAMRNKPPEVSHEKLATRGWPLEPISWASWRAWRFESQVVVVLRAWRAEEAIWEEEARLCGRWKKAKVGLRCRMSSAEKTVCGRL